MVVHIAHFHSIWNIVFVDVIKKMRNGFHIRATYTITLEARLWGKKERNEHVSLMTFLPFNVFAGCCCRLLISCRLFIMELRQVHTQNHNDKSIIAMMSNLRWLHILLSSFGYLKCRTNELSQLPSLYICIRLWLGTFMLTNRISGSLLRSLSFSTIRIRLLCATKKYDRAARKVW